jgi:hypothetical protein
MRGLIAIVAAGLLAASGSAQWGRARETVRDVDAGPIWSQADAERKCRALAEDVRGEWTGQWRTTQTGRASACQIRFGRPHRSYERDRGWGRDDPMRTTELNAGPIWNQHDAERKCPAVADRARGEWTGRWRTTEIGRMSVCEVRARR